MQIEGSQGFTWSEPLTRFMLTLLQNYYARKKLISRFTNDRKSFQIHFYLN